MCGTFTDDDLEKRVESATGDEIGTITAVDDETAQLEPQPGMIDSIKATLGWTSSSDTISIHDDDIDEITTDTVRLEGGALEGPMMAHQRALDAMASTATSYLNAVTAMTSPQDRRRSTASTEPGDEELFEALADHREHVRELRASIDDPANRSGDRVDDHADRHVAVLERQADLLERCQQQLEAGSE
ncbi:hypothetical protein D8Y22_07620 [Salinadaptatus halalkaliphilus]|uniref:Uncharacterized protein n=1 Tax=Salinadaptatus halalkaliphilus TaxID=2419781 RepID=A0A4S3TPI3_9EURY|nr:hypothetical protein [Salinadaptatus halalkaliphilus]THE65085.1 hypothetical protein D8Y22_07620 [Salinadaptatus halalkaliphilus]